MSFAPNYRVARALFLAAARDANATISTYEHMNSSLGSDTQACDVATIGERNAERAMIIVTGTHGIEGFCGSAIVHQWLLANRCYRPPEPLKLVFVHAINPWAFANLTRTTETNVDLNRNFVKHQQRVENPTYAQLARFFHCKTWSAEQNLDDYRQYKAHLASHGAHLEQLMVAGQTDFADGLYYSGTGPEWSNMIFRRIVQEHVGSARKIGFIDWHTGIGIFGEIVYLVFDPRDSEEYRLAVNWWGASRVAGSVGDDLPKYRGLLCQSIKQELSDRLVVGGVIEFGTADEYAMFRSDRLDRWLRFEGRNHADHEVLRNDYKNIFCPVDLSWRELVLREGPMIMGRMIDGMAGWNDKQSGRS